ncbi:MAG: hypothetical protein ACRDUW_24790, partial [Pseudonocardiaceae bacterium]
MARGTTAEERATATLIPLNEGPPFDEDVEDSFENWRASFDKAEEPGRITAYQIPLDERGGINLQQKTQIRLGAWAVDLYSFDELCDKIINEWMIPSGDKVMAVRFIGSKAGERGIRFNKIVMLRPMPLRQTQAKDSEARESTATLMKAFQEMNERTIAMLQRLQPAQNPGGELERILALSQMINKPMQDLMITLLPALVGRPSPAGGNSFDGLGAVLEGAARIAELVKGGGNSDDDNSLAGILRAVQPMVKPALEAIPHIV